jgi:signal transduction histidine kinase
MITFSSLKRIQKDLVYLIFFTLLSVILRFVQFRIPGYEDLSSDLRDIPLLIAIFHIRNPIIIIVFGFFTLLSAPQIPLFSHLALIYSLPHVAGLFFAWYAMKKIRKINQPDWLPSIYWCAVVLAYYYIFLITAAAIYHWYSNTLVEESILAIYVSIVKSTPLEVIATSLVTSLYLLQMNSKKALADQNKNLESFVNARTAEVQSANEKLKYLNEELITSNEKIKLANDNLEDMVYERTKKINDQLSQLLKYAHMNSHDVRAPLARIMGLTQLLDIETDDTARREIIKKLGPASKELDWVIKTMTQILSKEISV